MLLSYSADYGYDCSYYCYYDCHLPTLVLLSQAFSPSNRNSIP